MAPNREIRIATACSGSGAEVFTILAVVNTFRKLYPGLRFTYKFQCEKNNEKKKFIIALHEALATDLGATEPPCCFDDITALAKGEAKCCVHMEKKTEKKKNISGNNPVVVYLMSRNPDHNW